MKILTGCVALLAVIALGAVMKAAAEVFVPLVVAWLLSCVLSPLVRFLTGRGVPAAAAVAAALTMLLAAVAAAVALVKVSFHGFPQLLPVYYGRLMAIARELGREFDVPSWFWAGVDWSVGLRGLLLSLTRGVLNLTSRAVMVMIFVAMILAGTPYVEYKVRRAFGRGGARALAILEGISRQVSRFLVSMTLISVLTGLMTWGTLIWLGVDFAAAWGLLACLLNFIPNLGSIIAFFPPVLIAVVQFYPNPVMPLVTAGALLCIETVMGNVVTPKVMGDSLDLSPLTVLLFLLLWGWIWGMAGALLSTPLAAMVKILCDNFSRLETVGVLMESGESCRRWMEEQEAEKSGS